MAERRPGVEAEGVEGGINRRIDRQIDGETDREKNIYTIHKHEQTDTYRGSR